MDSHDAEATLDSSQKARRRSQIAAVAVLTAAILGLAGDDFVQARSQLEQGVRSWPNDGELQLLLAQTCRRAPEQDFGAARRHLQRVSEPSLKARADLEGVLLDIQQNGLPKSREEEARMLVAANPADERLILEAVVRGCLNNARRWAAHHWLSQWISRF